MSASAWDRAVEASVAALGREEWSANLPGYDLSGTVLAAALPLLLEELAQRIEDGTEGDYRAIPYRQSMQRAARMVRGFAAEVTQ